MEEQPTILELNDFVLHYGGIDPAKGAPTLGSVHGVGGNGFIDEMQLR